MRSERKRFIFVAVLAALILLLMAGTVFAQPVITTFKPDVDTQVVGESATWTVTSPNAVSYAFYVYKRGENGAPDQRVHTQWYSDNPEVTYKFLESGSYGARVFALDAEDKLTIVDSPEALDVVVTGDSFILTGLQFDPELIPVVAGAEMSCTVKPVGGEGPFQYAFYVFFLEDKAGAEWKRVHLQWYTAGDEAGYEFKYTPEEPGKYKVQAFIQDVSTKIVNDFSDEVTVGGTSQGLGISDITSEQAEGKITWTVTATGQGDLEYAFYVLKEEDGDWKRVDLQWYSDAHTCTYRPLESGNYRVRVFVLDVDTGKTVNGYSEPPVDFEDGEALSIDDVSLVGPPGEVGVSKTWKATVSGGQDPYEYAFYVYEDDNRVHMQWYSESNEVSYTPKKIDTEYWVRVFVIDAAGTLLVKDSDPSEFGGDTSVEPFGIKEVRFVEKVTKEVNTIDYYDSEAETPTESVTYDGYSLTDFRLPWVWEVVLPDNYEGMGEGEISYCYYLYKDGSRIDLQWYEEGEDTYEYKITEAGVYELRAFAMDEHGHIANKYSEPQETKLYHFNYTFDGIPDFDISDHSEKYQDAFAEHGQIFDKGYFFDRHPEVKEDPGLMARYNIYGAEIPELKKTITHNSNSTHFPLYDKLGNRGYSNQSTSVKAAVYFGEDGSKVYLEGKNELNASRWLSTGFFDKVTFAAQSGLPIPSGTYIVTGFDETDNSFALEKNEEQVSFTGNPEVAYDMSLAGMKGGADRTNYHTDTEDSGNGYLVLATDTDVPLTWKCSEEGGAVYRFAGIRPGLADNRHYYPRREFWRYMITPNLPYGEVYFRNIHSTYDVYNGSSDGEKPEGMPDQEARFNFEFMHHSTGKGGDPYDQRVGISISENGTIRILDTKAGRGIFDDADANFYMPVWKDKTYAVNECGFVNSTTDWMKLRIQGLANGKMQFFLNDELVYTTPLGYYHITNAEKGTITLEVVQAAVAASEGGEWNDNQIGNAVVELDNYSFGIMKYHSLEADPGWWSSNTAYDHD